MNFHPHPQPLYETLQVYTLFLSVISPATDATSNRTLHLQPNQVTLPDGNISTLPTNTTLFCIVESSSIVELPRQVNISWELPNGTTLNSTELVGVSSSISVDNPLSYSRVEALVLNQLSYRDAGIYTCKAEYVDLDGRFNLSGTVELQLLCKEQYKFSLFSFVKKLSFFRGSKCI